MNHAWHLKRPKRQGGLEHRPLTLVTVLALLLAISLPVGTGSPLAAGESPLADDPTQPWNIAADKITRDQKTGSLIASGNVIITKQGKR
ncbi:MAG: hypothetical protein GY697_15835, partial [Desulfobacterales bacterium]|nr:hypothetical protein [Desulfobacterales bacterium]